MATNTIITGILMNEDTTTISFTDICHMHHISEAELIELLEHGLFKQISQPITEVVFNQDMIVRLQSARRLQNDLGVNLPGVVLALELRDELKSLQEELNILRRHFYLNSER